MTYHLLTPQHQTQLAQERLLQLEAQIRAREIDIEVQETGL